MSLNGRAHRSFATTPVPIAKLALFWKPELRGRGIGGDTVKKLVRRGADTQNQCSLVLRLGRSLEGLREEIL